MENVDPKKTGSERTIEALLAIASALGRVATTSRRTFPERPRIGVENSCVSKREPEDVPRSQMARLGWRPPVARTNSLNAQYA